ncbi:hypothetical protein MKJ04_03965 [Pontibacter sp. E15-1]|uniref:hypothetical protein n=1 Tax=Pontibacter sp. E15-1 TaxID=2919918 RepID=UPI001F4FB66F|nr:hypothetical protein [Pontibacter sp. E15-1]MCJ8163985.1 hypothetical protein [Pontibacter sp. E15-1]
MRVSTTYLFVVLAISTLTACHQTEEVIPAPAPVDKTVVFEVFGNQDFSYSRYGEEEVTIQLLISRNDKDAPSGMGTEVLDSTFTMPLQDLPVRANRLIIKKVVPGVLGEKEPVFIRSGYHYRQTAFGRNQTFSPGQMENTVQLTVY